MSRAGVAGHAGGMVRILVVDDHEPFRNAVRDVVALLDEFEVVGEVDTGEDSLVAARLLAADLVLMDIHLPGIDGFEATRRLRAAGAPCAIVLVSTYDVSDLGDRVTGCGALAYLGKADFEPSSLADVWSLAG
jgi:DNA-binding NarL/FixJ family response regulator